MLTHYQQVIKKLFNMNGFLNQLWLVMACTAGVELVCMNDVQAMEMRHDASAQTALCPEQQAVRTLNVVMRDMGNLCQEIYSIFHASFTAMDVNAAERWSCIMIRLQNFIQKINDFSVCDEDLCSAKTQVQHKANDFKDFVCSVGDIGWIIDTDTELYECPLRGTMVDWFRVSSVYRSRLYDFCQSRFLNHVNALDNSVRTCQRLCKQKMNAGT